MGCESCKPKKIEKKKKAMSDSKNALQQYNTLQTQQNLQKQFRQPGQQTIIVGNTQQDKSQLVIKNPQELNQNALDNEENYGTVQFNEPSKLSNQYPSILPHQKIKSYVKQNFQPIQSNQMPKTVVAYNDNSFDTIQKINKEQFILSKLQNRVINDPWASKKLQNNIMQKNYNKNLTQLMNVQLNYDLDSQDGVSKIPSIYTFHYGSFTTKHGQSYVLNISKMRLTGQQQN